jgi:tyrosyl-tRNA synthetase
VRATLDALARKELHPREGKRKLARTITAELRSPDAAEEAEREFDRVHKEGDAPAEVTNIVVTPDPVRLTLDGKTPDVRVESIGIVDLLVRASLEKSKAAARRLVEQGGVRVDGAKADIGTVVAADGDVLIQVGKRRAARVSFR